jgi:hypothetical protein
MERISAKGLYGRWRRHGDEIVVIYKMSDDKIREFVTGLIVPSNLLSLRYDLEGLRRADQIQMYMVLSSVINKDVALVIAMAMPRVELRCIYQIPRELAGYDTM